VLRRRESIRRLVDDLADLPVRRRTALLARELDDQTPSRSQSSSASGSQAWMKVSALRG
jgi:hypothetical protein